MNEIQPVLSDEELNYALSQDTSKSGREWLISRNLQPLQQSGTMAYIYKKGSKDAKAKILIFRNFSQWPERNLRSPGVMGVSPFFSRSMSLQELKEDHFSWRMKYYAYAHWEDIEEDEALVGTSTEVIKVLMEFKAAYPLPALIPAAAIVPSPYQQITLNL